MCGFDEGGGVVETGSAFDYSIASRRWLSSSGSLGLLSNGDSRAGSNTSRTNTDHRNGVWEGTDTTRSLLEVDKVVNRVRRKTIVERRQGKVTFTSTTLDLWAYFSGLGMVLAMVAMMRTSSILAPPKPKPVDVCYYILERVSAQQESDRVDRESDRW